MDRGAFERAAEWLGGASRAGLEFTAAGIGFVLEAGSLGVGADGGSFRLAVNGRQQGWPARIWLRAGDSLDITPGPAGNYGYLRFDRELDLPSVLGSFATNSIASLGGFEGRALRTGDRLTFGDRVKAGEGSPPERQPAGEGAIRVIWGIHAELFDGATRQRFTEEPFAISARIDRMGARLEDRAAVFAAAPALSLVSDAVVPGDIQILGDGGPIVLLRDHQPTGGYPRLATVISADLDRFAQLRPGTIVRFEPVSLERAQAMFGRGPW
jgi:allophanate hydrolase subunit 2